MTYCPASMRDPRRLSLPSFLTSEIGTCNKGENIMLTNTHMNVRTHTHKHTYTHLWSSDNNSFSKVFQHEGESWGCVGHSVCAMQYHEGIKLSVIGLNVLANLSPVFHSHVAGVKQGIVLQYAVENAVLLGGQLTSVGHSAVHVCVCVCVWEREREREREKGRVYICRGLLFIFGYIPRQTYITFRHKCLVKSTCRLNSNKTSNVWTHGSATGWNFLSIPTQSFSMSTL